MSALATAPGGLGTVLALVRIALYAALLVFAGGSMLRAALGDGGRTSWMLPAEVRASMASGVAEGAARRERSLILDAGLLAIALAAAQALLDARAAGGSFSPSAVHVSLLSSSTGVALLWLVGLLVIAWVCALLAPRVAAGAAVVALGALVLTGHGESTTPRFLLDWVRVIADALLLGGVASAAAAWGRRPHWRGAALSHRTLDAVRARLTRVGLPALLVAALTAGIGAAMHLRRASSVWSSADGLGLLVEVALLGALAAIGCRRALASRNRPPEGAVDRRVERARGRWLPASPQALAGAALAATLVLLVCFALPWQLAVPAGLASPAAASENPGALPPAASDQLAVASTAGSDVVAAWVRPDAGRLGVELRVLGIRGAPADASIELKGASAPLSCGRGCERFSISAGLSRLRALVRTGADRGVASLPARWRVGESALAGRILDRAQATMRGLSSVREVELATSAPGLYALTETHLRAPDRIASTSYVVRPPHPPVLEGRSIQIGARTWLQAAGSGWQLQPPDGSLPFRTASWFAWSRNAEVVRLLSITGPSGHRLATLALMDPGAPAWWTLRVDMRDYRVTFARLIIPGEVATYRYSEFGRAEPIMAPRGARA